MTPSEKAYQLFNKFGNNVFNPEDDDADFTEKAKDSAIDCVNEILQAVDRFAYTGTMFNDFETGQIVVSDEKDPCAYWHLVKIELEKL